MSAPTDFSLANESLKQQVLILQKEISRMREELKQAKTERDRHLETLAESERIYRTIYDTTLALANEDNVDDVLRIIADRATELLESSDCAVYLIDNRSHILIPIYSNNYKDQEQILKHYLRLGEGLSGRVAQTGIPAYINYDDDFDYSSHIPDTDSGEDSFQSLISAPIFDSRGVAGVITISKDYAKFDDDDIVKLTIFASKAEIAMNRANSVQQLRQSEKELKEANAAKDKFMSIISHDLKNPLTGIIGFTEMLKYSLVDTSKDDLVVIISDLHDSAEKTYQLLSNLLDWSRLQRGKMDYQPSLLDTDYIIQNNLALHQATAKQKNITLKAKVGEGSFVQADLNMIDTVVRNLIANAIKFTPAGGSITVTSDINQENIQVTVTDSGIGMSASDLKKLFRIDEKFQNPGTNNEKGTGLGLILCKELVEMNRGRIWVESEVGRGTSFHFTLPKVDLS